MDLPTAVATALSFWAAQGTPVECAPEKVEVRTQAQFVADHNNWYRWDEAVGGYANGFDLFYGRRVCYFYLRDDWKSWPQCDGNRIVTHEIGHANLLKKHGDGVMSPELQIGYDPYFCPELSTPNTPATISLRHAAGKVKCKKRCRPHFKIKTGRLTSRR
jgi:hypothetical protein